MRALCSAATVLYALSVANAWQARPPGALSRLPSLWLVRTPPGDAWPSRTRAGLSQLVCAASKGTKRRKKDSAVGVETEVQRLKSAPFMREIEEGGMQCDKITLANFGKLRGVMAKVAIGSGETLVSYPRSAAMDLAQQGAKCPCSELIDEAYWQAAPWYQQLGLWYCHVNIMASHPQ